MRVYIRYWHGHMYFARSQSAGLTKHASLHLGQDLPVRARQARLLIVATLVSAAESDLAHRLAHLVTRGRGPVTVAPSNYLKLPGGRSGSAVPGCFASAVGDAK